MHSVNCLTLHCFYLSIILCNNACFRALLDPGDYVCWKVALPPLNCVAIRKRRGVNFKLCGYKLSFWRCIVRFFDFLLGSLSFKYEIPSIFLIFILGLSINWDNNYSWNFLYVYMILRYLIKWSSLELSMDVIRLSTTKLRSSISFNI